MVYLIVQLFVNPDLTYPFPIYLKIVKGTGDIEYQLPGVAEVGTVSSRNANMVIPTIAISGQIFMGFLDDAVHS